MAVEKTIYVGAFAHCLSLQDLEISPNSAIGVDSNGKIAFIDRDIVLDASPNTYTCSRSDWKSAKIVSIPSTGFFFPGFIDTHIHASQYPNAGIFGKSTLLDWLETYTFPMESSYADLNVARRNYTRVVSRTLSHGTTTACYYATVHVEATNLLSDICLAKGQRAFVGRVCMDRMSPTYYRDESVETAVAHTEACISHIRSIDPGHALITPVITPRFAPSCTTPVLAELGKLHKETQYPVQTHISENKSEIELVRELFPDSKHYTDVYDQAGLLSPKTILAHCVHLSLEEKTVIKARESKISHCPASNTAITSGTAKVRELLDFGLTVGLGTDVSGGYSPSILEEVRQAILVSRHVAMENGDAAKLSTEEALYLATRGGAKVVGLEDRIGGFEVGMDWDAQIIELGSVSESGEMSQGEGPVDIFMQESWHDRVNKWVYNGDDRNTTAVWVKGRLVHRID